MQIDDGRKKMKKEVVKVREKKTNAVIMCTSILFEK
jgi:hypothetical protein